MYNKVCDTRRCSFRTFLKLYYLKLHQHFCINVMPPQGSNNNNNNNNLLHFMCFTRGKWIYKVNDRWERDSRK